eukprot:CAMPEP_0179023340 /NCGR_PEP_ID=MMETSP0796-20121207/6878_1 /TAXON_ID=73915 /ORGANISM="Pyrodinium bahamense, Strain pbaha01" /LENGTH=284 /DNA_ID=CAMNT_0020719245 /DNA_START=292 /DNA_END=1143 /DNA_ORIENTATION=+
MSRQENAQHLQILDARKKELEEGLSKREFFEKYGFVLLNHETKMSAEDWLVNSGKPMPDKQDWERLREMATAGKVPVQEIYAKEIDHAVRDLVPGTTEVVYPRFVLRRGPGGPNNFYGLGVHQDFGVYPEEMKTMFLKDPSDPQSKSYDEWRTKLQDGSCKGFSIINFWRPVLPMQGPVRNTPLAVCDPNTVEMDDIVPQDLYGFVPGGQHNMGIKFSEKQKWYYYPDMTKNEVLVFRQFHYDRDVSAPYERIKTVFHTAFKHPGAPKDAEDRCSSEYRVLVYW